MAVKPPSYFSEPKLPLLLLVCSPPRHKRHGDSPHFQVLGWNRPVQFIREANLTAISTLVFRWSSLMMLRNFSQVFFCTTCEGMTRTLVIFNRISQHLNAANSQKPVLSPWHCHRKLFWAIYAFQIQFPWVRSKTRRNHIFSSNQPLESEFHLTRTIINTRWKAMQMVMAAQLTTLIQGIATLQHLLAESCTNCSYQSYWWFRELLNKPPCEVLTAVTIVTVAFWNVTRCIMVVI